MNTAQHPRRVVLLGSGRVATHLAQAIARHSGYRLVEIYSRRLGRARLLADALLPHSPRAVDRLEDLSRDADIYLFALSDHALEVVWASMPTTTGVWLHTAGSVSLEQMARRHEASGVLYPLQTFTLGRSLDWHGLPICIEGAGAEALSVARRLAYDLSGRVAEIDSIGRRHLHLSAVLACNFANHLIALGQHYLELQGIAPEILTPLIRETMSKLEYMPAREAQTGPALRGDTPTEARHLDLLADMPELRKLYQHLSQSIKTFHHNQSNEQKIDL